MSASVNDLDGHIVTTVRMLHAVLMQVRWWDLTILLVQAPLEAPQRAWRFGPTTASETGEEVLIHTLSAFY